MLPSPVDRIAARAFPKWWTRGTFNALQDVSLSVPRGSSLGLVGHNGAGKTTLLKLIAGVTSPTFGSIEVTGRVGALLDVAVGFHPDLTGVENAYLLGSIYGLRRRAMRKRVESILEFAGIADAATTPVKRYSTGMVARLGFGVMTVLDVDILLVDEVLAVGDASFQRKCIDWLDGYRQRGGTLVFVSHNLSLIKGMTERAVWLDHGQVAGDGPTTEIVPRYLQAMEERQGEGGLYRKRGTRKAITARGLNRWGVGGARVCAAHLREQSKDRGGLEVTIEFEGDPSLLRGSIFCVGFCDEGDYELAVAASPPLSPSEASGTVTCYLERIPFRSGVYFPVVAILTQDGRVRDRWRLDRPLIVEDGDASAIGGEFGAVNLSAEWSASDS